VRGGRRHYKATMLGALKIWGKKRVYISVEGMLLKGAQVFEKTRKFHSATSKVGNCGVSERGFIRGTGVLLGRWEGGGDWVGHQLNLKAKRVGGHGSKQHGS